MRQRQVDLCKVQASEVYTVRPCLKHKTKVSCPICLFSGSLQTLCLPKGPGLRAGSLQAYCSEIRILKIRIFSEPACSLILLL